MREELGGDQAGLDSFADPDVVGDEEADGLLAKRHEQGNVLVRARVNREGRERAERSARRAEPDSKGVAQEGGGAGVAEIVGGRRREGGVLNGRTVPLARVPRG